MARGAGSALTRGAGSALIWDPLARNGPVACCASFKPGQFNEASASACSSAATGWMANFVTR